MKILIHKLTQLEKRRQSLTPTIISGNEYVTITVNRNLSNCEKARKKGFRGFIGIRTRGLCVSAAVLYQPEL